MSEISLDVAADKVCLECGLGNDNCEFCPVRRLMDKQKKSNVVIPTLYEVRSAVESLCNLINSDTSRLKDYFDMLRLCYLYPHLGLKVNGEVFTKTTPYLKVEYFYLEGFDILRNIYFYPNGDIDFDVAVGCNIEEDTIFITRTTPALLEQDYRKAEAVRR